MGMDWSKELATFSAIISVLWFLRLQEVRSASKLEPSSQTTQTTEEMTGT